MERVYKTLTIKTAYGYVELSVEELESLRARLITHDEPLETIFDETQVHLESNNIPYAYVILKVIKENGQ